ncbi:MAG: hypothetical protein ACYTDY_10350 [Planctomycetota bacterium]
MGGTLAVFGGIWLATGDTAGSPWLLVPAAILGLVKARFLLRPAADRVIERIRQRGDGRCAGGFLSPRTWLFVLLMAAAGRLLRSTPVPRAVIGFVYLAVGVALPIASVRIWGAWRRRGV